MRVTSSGAWANPIDVFAISNDGDLLHLCYANDGWAFPLEEWKGAQLLPMDWAIPGRWDRHK